MNQNIELILKNINTRFSRLAHQLGSNNTVGTLRNHYEVEMAYIMNEFKYAPDYIIPKYVDDANKLLDALIRDVKQLRTQA
jgi:hypothetical protein